VWAQELSLMAVDLLARLNAVLGEEVVRELRCRTG
jgi:predicted nucleic acid-binding Zn ribbon protein